MHRSPDRWQRTGSELFSETERQVRKRIWYSCVIMDKYVSTYIGELHSLFSLFFGVEWVGVYDKAVCDEVVQPTCTFTCIREHLLNFQC